jgi:hypothetical protein
LQDAGGEANAIGHLTFIHFRPANSQLKSRVKERFANLFGNLGKNLRVIILLQLGIRFALEIHFEDAR